MRSSIRRSWAKALSLSKERILPANQIAHLACIARSQGITPNETGDDDHVARERSCYRDSSVSIGNAAQLLAPQTRNERQGLAGTGVLA
jgi:hypothetical protein